uniref:tryptophan--tRNA ligase n=1 Tax=Saccoglossus kowalevskii TaxID=10224 RepID=A0ABM0MNN7_SACKO|nr:PREDICTED: tryptophan--tRNA ligase, mitochondrial-like [Saccoglossus kowalevskii]
MRGHARLRIILTSFCRVAGIRRCSTTSNDTQDDAFPKRIFSGIQPTGIPHIGNYLGAVTNWVRLQEASQQDEVIFCVVDMHSITLPQDPQQLKNNIYDMVACLLACGIDPKKSILFQQSAVQQHAELAWVLGCITTMKRLGHLPQWKTKSAKRREGVCVGLYTYPVLMSADILLYKATHVPVGDDQIQHVELTQDIARVFNNLYGNFFPRPQVLFSEVKKVKSLRDPSSKMSKSDSSHLSRIELTDTDKEIHMKFRKAVTDFTSAVTYDPDRLGVTNIINIHSAFTGITPDKICDDVKNLTTAEYKKVVADAVIENLTPVRDEITRLQQEKHYIEDILKLGADRARTIAMETYNDVKKLVGFL